MTDRKESLLRTLKMQYEQLEQWEHKRSLFNDPDERMRCDDKIKDIKALIKQNEEELKKLKGGGGGKRTGTTTADAGPEQPYMIHNEIVINNSNESWNNNSGNHAINNNQGSGNIIISPGPADGEEPRAGDPFSFSTFLMMLVSIALAVGVFLLILKFCVKTDFTSSDIAPQALYFFITLTAIVVLYKYPGFSFHPMLRFAVSIIILCIYAGPFLGGLNFDEPSPARGYPSSSTSVAVLVIIPLLIGAIGAILTLNYKEIKGFGTRAKSKSG